MFLLIVMAQTGPSPQNRIDNSFANVGSSV